MLRVVGGEARGRLLRAPASRRTRPTSDKVREALFSILDSLGADLERCLDLYAGSGALGIEALSRGAGHVDFVESDHRACSVIRDNLRSLRYEDRATVYQRTAAGFIRAAAPGGPYTLVLADPPYDLETQDEDLRLLAETMPLTDDAILVLEHSKRRTPPTTYGRLGQIQTRRYGDSSLTLYRPGA